MKNKFLFLAIVLFSMSIKSQNKKDTLFIKYDFKLLKRGQNPVSKEYYYLIKDSQIESGYIYFSEKKVYKNEFSPKSKIYCLRNIINKANAFSKKDKKDLKDYKLFDYFNNQTNYTTYFLVKKDKFIEIGIVYAIE